MGCLVRSRRDSPAPFGALSDGSLQNNSLRCRITYLRAAVENGFTRRASKCFLRGEDRLHACGTCFLYREGKLGREGSTALLSSNELLRRFSEPEKVEIAVHRDGVKLSRLKRSEARCALGVLTLVPTVGCFRGFATLAAASKLGGRLPNLVSPSDMSRGDVQH